MLSRCVTLVPTCVSPGYSVRGQVADLEAARVRQEAHLDDELRVVLLVELVTRAYSARNRGEQPLVLPLELGAVGQLGDELLVSRVHECWVTAQYAQTSAI